ncbi:3-demethylubiquinone-9 3-methyltransferase [Dacryopinax primogenitus]|uniref:3-demethylubiquinone-9 3-methyltransferase n=1 Tax=Dacryopinax primogenitus (strain DJM 731) TaxID=1858805 RepID=M5FNE5_DACPD|nr:3-demethylubiquinone-9 3-methyltransferase [Dacryopinax primogenitus]EJT97305.1 3-demethylubiquinone-9 3-methyltransferase [Dacryopinax primogenitus]
MGTSPPKVQTFLWFDTSAQSAASFYQSAIPGCTLLSQNQMSVTLSLSGHELILFNGGPSHALSPAVSLFLTCSDQAEIDDLWAKLRDGGEEIACGWVKDKFGLCWQVVPRGLDKLVFGSGRAMQVMRGQKKLEIEPIRKAAAEDGVFLE